TQPMPGPLSWFFHRLPGPLHRVEVAANHVAQLAVPFALFTPQPVASVAGGVIVVTQLWLVASGNFSWLNWVTILLALAAVDGRRAAQALGLPEPPPLAAPPVWHEALVLAATVLVVVLSYWPARNLVSGSQLMNYSFNPLHLVNTYGAFGSGGTAHSSVNSCPRSPSTARTGETDSQGDVRGSEAHEVAHRRRRTCHRHLLQRVFADRFPEAVVPPARHPLLRDLHQ
ncbi:lipase maturation factor family protein, partial [Streptomyces sp. MCAF7]